MRPILFTIFGLPIQSYGVSKVLAALAAAGLLGRAFAQNGLPKDDAHRLVLGAAIWGFIGAKAYYLIEHPGEFHHLGAGFTWYGGLIAGTLAALVVAHRRGLPVATVAGLAAAPLALAYGIGRLGCLLAGDGTFGKPSTLPWAMRFPNGSVPTTGPVQPTPLYEALFAFALAAALWWLGRHVHPALVVSTYLVASSAARIAVEYLRINQPVWLGLTAPQLWSVALLAAGIVVAVRARHMRAATSPTSGAKGALS